MSYRHTHIPPERHVVGIAAGALLALSACAARPARAPASNVSGWEGGVLALPGTVAAPDASGTAGTAGTAGAAGAPAAAEDDTGVPIHGFVSTRYRFRDADGDGGEDEDFYVTVALDVGDAERHPVTGHVMARGIWDIDGDSGDSSAFASIHDTYDGDVQGELYHAYVDLHQVDGVSRLRLGRQQIYETPEFVLFDGARIESDGLGAQEVQWGVYGGIPVHLHESSSEGDSLFGALVKSELWAGASGRLDYMRIEDERVTLTDDEADLYGVHLQQDVGKVLHFELDHTRLDDERRDMHLRGTYYDQQLDLTLQGRFYRLFERQVDLVNELDPFSRSLLQLEPFSQAAVLFSKGLGEHLGLDGGLDRRFVEEDDDIGKFNRDVDRYFLTASVSDLPRESTVSLTGEIWEGEGDDIETIGLDMGTELVMDKLEGSIGSFYSLYKYDAFDRDEKDHVRTYYVDLTHRREKAGKLRLRYEYENDDIDEYHSVRLGWTVNF